MIIFLDTSVLGILCNPNPLPMAISCQTWFERSYGKGVYFVSSAVCFYELKRGLLIAVKRGATTEGIERLEYIADFIDFFKVDRPVAELAAELWARGRLRGQPTADEKNLDIDTIIMAHWQLLSESFPGQKVTIATTNVRHLSLFAEAKEWQDITY